MARRSGGEPEQVTARTLEYKRWGGSGAWAWDCDDGCQYIFYATVRNCRPLFAPETLSFKVQNVARVEHDGAWFAHVWPHVHEQTKATGVLLAERAKISSAAERSYDR